LNPSELVRECCNRLGDRFSHIDEVADANLDKIIRAFGQVGLTTGDLAGSTGYGLGDISRDKLEKVYSIVFGTEAALVRPQIASGTHALACVLFGILRPDDIVVSITGTPYETLQEVIGIRQAKGSLAEFGVSYAQTDWRTGTPDPEIIRNAKLVMIQRSSGYRPGKPVSLAQIEKWSKIIKSANPDAIIMVDNCYCELMGLNEPAQAGADLTVGSLIKNPGGGLAITGGYIAGSQELIELVATRVTAPGIGAEVGATWGFMMDAFRGLFLAPSAVASAHKGALLWSEVFHHLGYEVNPKPGEDHIDTVVSIKLGSRKKFIDFGKAIQSVSPIDSRATPEPFAQQGYDAPVMLAGGGFVSGGTSDLSADGLDRKPWTVYVQGGVNLNHIRLGIAATVAKVGKFLPQSS
jgi:cystathionine beta-lyase family protein involved in aluminum resistance